MKLSQASRTLLERLQARQEDSVLTRLRSLAREVALQARGAKRTEARAAEAQALFMAQWSLRSAIDARIALLRGETG